MSSEAAKAIPERASVQKLLETGPTRKGPAAMRGRTVIQGVPVVSGLAAGRTFRYQDIFSREMATYGIKENGIDAELKRLDGAIRNVESDLVRMRHTVKKQVGSDQAAIFEAHRLILRDMTLLKEIDEEVRSQRVNIEHVVRQVFRRWERKLRDSQNIEIRGRSSDIADIGRRLLKELLGIRGNALTRLPAGAVIFAKRLLPSDTVHLDRKNARGIVTEEGGPNSHVAILARAFHIPLVSRIDVSAEKVANHVPVILDGDTGRIVLRPTRKEMSEFKSRRTRDEKRDLALARKMSRVKLETVSWPVTIDANVSSAEECRTAKLYGCDGVGLYRIEQVYMSSPVMPTEEFLLESLRRSLNLLKGREVTVRLLDIGGDKTLPYINLVERTNPALGVRGVRLLLKYPNLLQAQLRVFLRLSAKHKLRVLVPMVTLAQDMALVRKALDQEKEKLKEKKVGFDAKLALGAMIETPSAVLAIDSILEICDFVSVGTNDLLQYTMAADRENMNVAEYYDSGNPLILKWIAEIVQKAGAAGKDCEVCGELAGNLDHTEALLRSGVRHLSVVAHRIPKLKEKIQGLLVRPPVDPKRVADPKRAVDLKQV